MLGRPHVVFHGRGQDPRQLVDHVENAVEGDLVAPLLLRLVQEQFRLHSGDVRGVAAFLNVVLYHVICVVFLANGDVLFLAVAGRSCRESAKMLARRVDLLCRYCTSYFEHPPGAKDLVSRRD